MLRTIKCLIIITVSLLFALSCSTNIGRQKPNVILVFIDDMGWADFSCFGNVDAQTPNIDKMAAEGVSFEQFYVNSPICSPSRVAISTGTYPQRWKITSYLAHRNQNTERGMAQWLNPKAPMLARSLKEAGYATGHFGKWHMGGQRDVSDAPAITEYGFDESLTNFEGMGAKLLPLTIDENGIVGRIWEKAEILGEPVTWMQRSEITGGFIDAAIPFMEKAQKEGKPFYVNLWPDDVHSPFWPPYEEYGLAKESGKRGLYLAVLEAMDKQFGKLFDYIRMNDELRDNTLIIFASDNGGDIPNKKEVMPENFAVNKGLKINGDLRGDKHTIWEGGFKIPFIINYPKEIKGNQTSEATVSTIDIYAFLADYVGHNKGLDEKDAPDSFSFKKVVENTSANYERPPLVHRDAQGRKAVRFENWKYIETKNDKSKKPTDKEQLFDLAKDGSESNNVVSEESSKTKEAKNYLIQITENPSKSIWKP